MGQAGLKKFQPLGTGMVEPATELGQFIRDRRIELGITQTSLATKLGVAQNTVSSIERGERIYLSRTLLRKFAGALKCKVSDLKKKVPVKYVAKPKTALGKFIRSRREELGLSYADLAERVGLGVKSVHRIELNGNSTILPKTAEVLAGALEVDIKYFYQFYPRAHKKSKSPLGRLIQDLRKEKGMTCRDLATRLNVSRQFVNQIELGNAYLSVKGDLLKKIASILQVDVDEFKIKLPRKKMYRPSFERRNRLGAFLTEQRLILNQSQKDVAQRAGISYTTLCGIETGKYWKSVNATTLARIADALGCEIPEHLLPKRLKNKR